MNRLIDSDSLKKIQLDILKSIDLFCVKNNIKYFLCGGSCIGAIRHNGFIPWDDDIDVAMPREDFDFFVHHFFGEHYRVFTSKDKKYFFPFCKVSDIRTTIQEKNSDSIPGMGVFVDVFPIDGLGNDFNKAVNTVLKNQKSFFKIYKGTWKIQSILKPKNFFRLLCKIRSTVFRKRMLNNLEKTCKGISFDKSEYCGVAFGFYGKKEVMKKDYYIDYKLVQFENYMFRVPIGYDCYLKTMYGNYLELPPKEKQKTHHSFDAYWRN